MGSVEKEELALEVDEHIKSLEMSVGTLPKLPIYMPKGVRCGVNDIAKQQAMHWAYKYWYSASDNSRRFIVNAVAALFEWELIKYCSEGCFERGPCTCCGHWEWVSEPLDIQEKNKNSETTDNMELRVATDMSIEELFLNDTEVKRMVSERRLITNEAKRCALSLVIASKADFWTEGCTSVEGTPLEEEWVISKKTVLGSNVATMLKDLYPSWSVEDGAEVVLTASLWANTRHVLSMVANAPLPKCLPLWEEKSEVVLNLSPELRQAFGQYPTGTEVVLEFLEVAKKLVKSLLVIYFPKVEDLQILTKTLELVKENPFHYHKYARFLGLEPMGYDVHSVYGRLGSFYLADTVANNKSPSTYWSREKILASNDYDEEFQILCEAFYGLKKSEENAYVLMTANAENNYEEVNKILSEYKSNITEGQKKILNME